MTIRIEQDELEVWRRLNRMFIAMRLENLNTAATGTHRVIIGERIEPREHDDQTANEPEYMEANDGAS